MLAYFAILGGSVGWSLYSSLAPVRTKTCQVLNVSTLSLDGTFIQVLPQSNQHFLFTSRLPDFILSMHHSFLFRWRCESSVMCKIVGPIHTRYIFPKARGPHSFFRHELLRLKYDFSLAIYIIQTGRASASQ